MSSSYVILSNRKIINATPSFLLEFWLFLVQMNWNGSNKLYLNGEIVQKNKKTILSLQISPTESPPNPIEDPCPF